MKVHKKEILIYYNPESSNDKKTVAYARSMSNHVTAYPFDNIPTMGRIWRKILDMLDLHPKELMNKAIPYYQRHIRGREFDEEGWLKVLIRNPYLLKAPIAIKGNQAVLCTNAMDIYKLQQRQAAC